MFKLIGTAIVMGVALAVIILSEKMIFEKTGHK